MPMFGSLNREFQPKEHRLDFFSDEREDERENERRIWIEDGYFETNNFSIVFWNKTAV
jgi:hypothetical protein